LPSRKRRALGEDQRGALLVVWPSRTLAARAHATERFEYPSHRPATQARIAVESRSKARPRDDPREQTHRRPTIAAVQHLRRKQKPFRPAHSHLVRRDFDLDSELLQTAQGGADVLARRDVSN